MITDEKRAELKSALLTKIVNVKFTKVDGSERIMLCTQNGSTIRTVTGDDTINEITSTAPESVFRVFDMEKKAFRSFRKDSVISYTIE